MTRPPGGPATRALVGLVVALAAVTALTRACEVVVPDPPGEVVQLVPVRFDAGVSQ